MSSATTKPHQLPEHTQLYLCTLWVWLLYSKIPYYTGVPVLCAPNIMHPHVLHNSQKCIPTHSTMGKVCPSVTALLLQACPVQWFSLLDCGMVLKWFNIIHPFFLVRKTVFFVKANLYHVLWNYYTHKEKETHLWHCP